MPGTNSFYPYGESSTNILNNSEYQTDSERSSGAQSGAIARSKMYNKQARQAAAGAYAVGALVAKSGKNADDSSAATLAANFQAAVNYQAAHFVASAVSVSGTTATATVAELATTAAADLPALFALSLVLDQALPAGASIAIASSLPDVTLSWPIYVGSEALDSDTITGGAITLLIDTVGAKAFFKAGGMGKLPSDLAPLCPNFTVERNGGKVKISADKIQLNSYTNMVSGGVWAWGKTRPTKPTGENTKLWSREELIGTVVQLSELTEGGIVKINESGNPVDFYVAKHDYESDLNGAGRTLMVRKDCYDDRVWDSGRVNAYANSAFGLKSNGVINSYDCSNTNGSRPAFTLPGDAYVTDNGDGTYTFIGDKPTIEIDWPESDPLIARQWVYNEKGVYQTMLLGGIASTEDAPAFKLPEFTGNHAIFGDEIAGRIELYESGDLMLYPGTYDFFLVGGGAGGNPIATNYYRNPAGGGGGSGYTATQKAISLDSVTAIFAFIGAGGASQTAGTDTSLSYTGTSPWSYTAAGAPAPTPGIYGGDGGSGGGEGASGNADDGGAGGADGAGGGYSGSSSRYAGTGQGTTTRAFGESANTLYAGAGGGGVSGAYGTPGPGGAGGGGTGGVEARNGQAATPNTGGGGGGGGGTWSEDDQDGGTGGTGGSGIIIVRWNNT